MKASVLNLAKVLPESLLHIPTFQWRSQNAARSNYFRLSPDANGATSLVLWLSEEPECIFNEFRMVIKLKWNCWAEGICNPIIVMSQHKGNSDEMVGDCITFALVSAFNVPGCLGSCPLGNANTSLPIETSPFLQVSDQIFNFSEVFLTTRGTFL